MPVTKQALTEAMIASFKAVDIAGPKTPNLARAISTAYVGWLGTLGVQTTHVGVLGSGVGNGSAVLAVPQGVTFLSQALSGLSISGPKSKPLAQGVAQAIGSLTTSASTVQVTITGTSTGTGVGSLTQINAKVLQQKLNSAFQGNGIQGPKKNALAKSLSQGIANWAKTATVQTIDTGSPVFPFSPSTGTGTGSIR